ncbi:MAG: glycosylase [Eubacterium sp.]|nr:glycosylase [Eubacterium sp.]
MTANWLNDAVFYEIYPQSFRDSDGDGIGDINGIREKLDYIRSLGCNAIWINACFDSPFRDGGYDVRDYKKVAPRYGTNEDLCALFREAHEKEMHVLLDLVAGHTSEEHSWFLHSGSASRTPYDDRYIWTDGWLADADHLTCIRGECARDGGYIVNFFKCQPALNYGFLHPAAPWQHTPDHPSVRATCEAIVDVMRFWLSKGCDGFRADMADSLVKNDDGQKSGTCAVWKMMREMLDEEYPGAVLVSEWGIPGQALRAGFNADFYLDWSGNAYNSLMRDYETDGEDRSYFKKDAGGSICRFLNEYLPRYQDTKNLGHISMITGNHDTIRAAHTLSQAELKLAYAVLFTLPGVPFLYYGDEIGMRHLELPTKEGGYHRTGSRTPMQWHSGPNLGFSEAPAESLYLPVDRAPDAPTVAGQEQVPASLLQTVRTLIWLRHEQEELHAGGSFEVLNAEPAQPFVYRRGNLICAVNPDGCGREVQLESPRRILFQIGSGHFSDGILCLGAQSFVIAEQS